MSSKDQKIVAEDRTLVLTRLFNAPRDLVFQMWSNCEHLRNWWGPRSWPMVECSMDFKVGGVWHYCLRGPNPEDASWGRAEFNHIASPERIEYTDTFCDADGVVNQAMPQVRSSLEFADLDGKTVLTMTATYETPDALRMVIDMGMEAGITETFDRLDEHLDRSMTASAS